MEKLSLFDLRFELYEPAEMDYILEFEEEIRNTEGMEDFQICQSLKDFYNVSLGFELSWRYLLSSEGVAPICGNSNISMLYDLLEPGWIEDDDNADVAQTSYLAIWEQYRIFDLIGDGDHIDLKFHRDREEPRLYYFSEERNNYYLMSVGFCEYFELLLETRALSPWQRFFICDNEFILEEDRKAKFISDLKTLFPTVNTSRFV
ncbi:MAG: hypothetical protein F6K26_03910 [Moorea sp. SIO2I5]|nr:hypothetical protein [Moorena sp. SIO2I5]